MSVVKRHPRRSAARHRPSRSTSGSRRRSRSRSSRRTRSRRPRTRPRRSSSSPRVGASSLALGLDTLIPIAIAVAILLAIVVTSYRQTIFAYPSGGGSLRREPREPRRDTRRSSPARRCSSTTSSPSRCRSRPASPRSSRSPQFESLDRAPRRARARAHRAHHAREPARAQGVGTPLRGPDLHLHRHARPRSSCSGSTASFVSATSGTVPFDPEAFEEHAATPAARSASSCILQGLLVGRGRAHRCRGDLQRRAGVPAAGVEERGRRR